MSDTPQPWENPAQTMRDVMEEIGDYSIVTHPAADVSDADITSRAHLITLPKDRRLEDITAQQRTALEWLKPTRRRGTARLEHLDSLIDWANRFKGEASALYAKPDMEAPTLTCISDYHQADAPADGKIDETARHCAHRAIYSFPLSEEWKAWMRVSGKPLDKDDMGEFIEANAKDVMDPTPAILKGEIDDKNQPWENRLITTAAQIEGRFGQLHQLLAMSRQFQVFEKSDLQVSSNRDTGEAMIQFKSEHRDATGAPLVVPNLIIVTIPVFRGGAPYRMPVRFRYRKMGGEVKFILTVYNPEKSFEAAFNEATARATEETGLPLFLGTPEA
ncbi:DUF2303 family protein [Sagittula sp.]|uniref:DUF2303 family protein n=1 Tax=Sagittula sp. TaxID=2038081 RepID=UPI00351352B4